MNRFHSGLKFSGIAGKAALLSVVSKEAAKKYLIESLASIDGLPRKVVQYLDDKVSATLPSVEASASHRKQVLSIEHVKAQLEVASPELCKQLEYIEESGISASLGQVHRGILKSGEAVAIKVRYPGVEVAVQEQLNILFQAMRLSPLRKDVEKYKTFLTTSFTAELDYRLEAEAQREFFSLWEGSSEVIVPRVMSSYVTQELLVTEWHDVNFLSASASSGWSVAQRRAAAELYSRFVLKSIFQHRRAHTDPNFGNFGFRFSKHPCLVLFDFGSSLTLEEKHSNVLAMMLKALVQGESFPVFDYFCALGFEAESLSKISHRLPWLCQKLFEPWISTKPWHPSEWNLKKSLECVLGDDIWYFRKAGPAWFLPLMRVIHGWFNVCSTLNTNLFMRDFLGEFIAQVKPVSVPCVGVEFGLEYILSSSSAHALCVRILEGTEEKVSLRLPARAIDELEDIIPPAVAERIVDEGGSLFEMKRKVQRSGYLPQQILLLEKDNKVYKVWLE